MSKGLQVFAVALLLSFMACCVASAALQLIAHLRHSRGGPGGLRAMWQPEGKFDEIGVFQMRLAKRLLLIGAVAYLSYGVVTMVAHQVDVRG
jgi:hypothetical protein